MDVFDSYQSNRIVDRLHAVAQVVLAFLILGAINYIGMRHFKRIDLTLGHDYTLSAETLAYLKKLDRPIDVIVTLSSQDNNPATPQILRDVKGLLGEYEYVTRNNGENRIRIEYLNVFQQTKRAKELGIEHNYVIVFKSGERSQTVTIDELYSLHDEDLREFLGENVFTRSVLKLLEIQEPIIYFTTGHGELKLNDFEARRGGSQFYNELKSRNYTCRGLDLSTIDAIPEDASLIFIAGPITRFLPEEQEILRHYLKRRSGRVILLEDPNSEHGLDDLFYEWGILSEKALVVERDHDSLLSSGDLMIKRFWPSHPITGDLINRGVKIITDQANSVREDLGRPIDDSLVVTELMETSTESWGEKSQKPNERPTFSQAVDLPGPIRVATISERKVDSSLGITIPGGKFTVIGTASFISNNRIQTAGNLFFALNTINYSLDRASRLNIPPRPIQKVKLDMSMQQLHLSRYLIWLGPPALIGLLGLCVYVSRRY